MPPIDTSPASKPSGPPANKPAPSGSTPEPDHSPARTDEEQGVDDHDDEEGSHEVREDEDVDENPEVDDPIEDQDPSQLTEDGDWRPQLSPAAQRILDRDRVLTETQAVWSEVGGGAPPEQQAPATTPGALTVPVDPEQPVVIAIVAGAATTTAVAPEASVVLPEGKPVAYVVINQDTVWVGVPTSDGGVNYAPVASMSDAPPASGGQFALLQPDGSAVVVSNSTAISLSGGDTGLTITGPGQVGSAPSSIQIQNILGDATVGINTAEPTLVQIGTVSSSVPPEVHLSPNSVLQVGQVHPASSINIQVDGATAMQIGNQTVIVS
ncbi:MAG: hypothetical protein AB1758_38010, partial [Candidatus Eremiobacterota bacterium]